MDNIVYPASEAIPIINFIAFLGLVLLDLTSLYILQKQKWNFLISAIWFIVILFIPLLGSALFLLTVRIDTRRNKQQN